MKNRLKRSDSSDTESQNTDLPPASNRDDDAREEEKVEPLEEILEQLEEGQELQS